MDQVVNASDRLQEELAYFPTTDTQILLDVDENYWTYVYEYKPVQENSTQKDSSIRSISVPSEEGDTLPEGWEEKTNVEGVVFYFNAFTGFCQWDPPRLTTRKRFERVRKPEMKSRHMNQILLRGDCVVTVSLATGEEKRELSDIMKLRLEN